MNCGEYIFSFVRLDKFIELFRRADKKRQETKQTYCADKQKINSTGINDDCITTERPAANPRLCTPAGCRAFRRFCARIHLVAVRQ